MSKPISRSFTPPWSHASMTGVLPAAASVAKPGPGSRSSAWPIATPSSETEASTGCDVSQWVTRRPSVTPRARTGSEGGTAAMTMYAPGPSGGTIVPSNTARSLSPPAPSASPLATLLTITFGREASALSRKKFPAPINRTRTPRAGANTAKARLSAARSSAMPISAVTRPLVGPVQGTLMPRASPAASVTCSRTTTDEPALTARGKVAA